MIEWNITMGRGGKFIFKPDNKGRYEHAEREAVRISVIAAVRRLIEDLMSVTPMVSGTLATSWRVEVADKVLKDDIPESRHGRGSTSRGMTPNISGVQFMGSQYELGDKVIVFNGQEYAGIVADGHFPANLKFSKSPAASAAFGAGIASAMANFDIRFEAARR